MPMSTAKRVVLVSKQGYDESHDSLLEELIARRIEVFCAVGKDCQLWEEAMDELLVGPHGEGDHLILTTAHPDESVEDVVEFAKSLVLKAPSDVEVIEV